MRNQLVAETATYTAYNKQKGRTSMSSVGLEYAIEAMEQLQTARSSGTAP